MCNLVSKSKLISKSFDWLWKVTRIQKWKGRVEWFGSWKKGGTIRSHIFVDAEFFFWNKILNLIQKKINLFTAKATLVIIFF
ncbi:hypothetical protein YC2023_101572 [Brassica napus]